MSKSSVFKRRNSQNLCCCQSGPRTLYPWQLPVTSTLNGVCENQLTGITRNDNYLTHHLRKDKNISTYERVFMYEIFI